MEAATLNVKNLPISTKQSVEICRFIRNMNITKAKYVLNNVLKMKQAIPYLRYNMNTPHKPGMTAARYPIKSCSHILKMLESVEHNAIKEGMSKDLIVSHISAHKGVRQWHYGRQRRRKTKSTNIKIILTELKSKIEEKKSIASKSTAKSKSVK